MMQGYHLENNKQADYLDMFYRSNQLRRPYYLCRTVIDRYVENLHFDDEKILNISEKRQSTR